MCVYLCVYGKYLTMFTLTDLQLDVKGCRDVYASFDKYVEVERLEGDNKYHAEQHGLQVSCLCCEMPWKMYIEKGLNSQPLLRLEIG